MARKNKKFIPEVGQEVECFCCDSKRDKTSLDSLNGHVKLRKD